MRTARANGPGRAAVCGVRSDVVDAGERYVARRLTDRALQRALSEAEGGGEASHLLHLHHLLRLHRHHHTCAATCQSRPFDSSTSRLREQQRVQGRQQRHHLHTHSLPPQQQLRQGQPWQQLRQTCRHCCCNSSRSTRRSYALGVTLSASGRRSHSRASSSLKPSCASSPLRHQRVAAAWGRAQPRACDDVAS